MPDEKKRSVKPWAVAGALATALGVTTVLGTAAAPAQAPSKEEIAKLFDRWNAALQTGKPDEVVKLYAADAVLLPTVSNKVRTTADQIKDYYARFLELKPKGRIDERHVRLYGDVAIDSGIYTFTLTKQGKKSDVQARYTFVYQKQGDRWMIVEHHSSAMPEATKEGDKH